MAINYVGQLVGDPQQSAKSTQPKVSISVTKKEAGSEPVTLQSEEGVLPPVVTASIPAIITVGAGRTVNLGNFNSARVDVQIAYPCAVDDIEAGWEFAYGWVDKKITEVLKDSGVEV